MRMWLQNCSYLLYEASRNHLFCVKWCDPSCSQPPIRLLTSIPTLNLRIYRVGLPSQSQMAYDKFVAISYIKKKNIERYLSR